MGTSGQLGDLGAIGSLLALGLTTQPTGGLEATQVSPLSCDNPPVTSPPLRPCTALGASPEPRSPRLAVPALREDWPPLP